MKSGLNFVKKDDIIDYIDKVEEKQCIEKR